MSLPPELDFDRDREASPARMNRAMEYLFLRLGAATALQPEFESSIVQLQAVGLERLNEVLTPLFVNAISIADQLEAIRASWLAGEPLANLLDGLADDVTARIATVDAQLASNLAGVVAQLAKQDTAIAAKIAAIGPAATWAEATIAEVRRAAATRLLSPAVLYAAQVPVALVDSATIALDLDSGINFALTIAGNRVLASPTNAKPGQHGSIFVTQDATGGRTLSFGAAYIADDLVNYPVLNAAAGAVTELRYKVTGDGKLRLSGGKPAMIGYTLTFQHSSTMNSSNGGPARVLVGAAGRLIAEKCTIFSTGQLPNLSTYNIVRTRNGVTDVVGTLTFANGSRSGVFSFSDASAAQSDVIAFLLTNSPAAAPSDVLATLYVATN